MSDTPKRSKGRPKKKLTPQEEEAIRLVEQKRALKLTAAQKKYIDENWQRHDASRLTKDIFNNPNLNVKHFEGIAVKKYLDEMGYDIIAYKEEVKKQEAFGLTEDQEDFVINNFGKMSPMDIAKIIFENDKLEPLSREKRSVDAFIKKKFGAQGLANYNSDGDFIVPYNPPTHIKVATGLIRDRTGKNLPSFLELDKDDLKRVEGIIGYLNNYRFRKAIENYERPEDRDLFEATFIDYTFDKPDLIMSEVQTYINVCIDHVKMHKYERQLDSLNNRRNKEINEDRPVSQSLTEAIEKATTQYDKAASRVSKNIRDLEGTRNERMKNVVDKNRTILSLIEQMKTEEGRKRMLHIQKIQNELVAAEVKHLANAGEEIAKIMGLHENEVII